MNTRLAIAAGLAFVLASGSMAKVIRVKPTGNDSSDGSTWALAKKTITAAMTAATSGDAIWVVRTASKSYKETAVVTLKSGVGLLGGFAGTETSAADRDPATNVTVIDGQGAHGVIAVTPGAAVNTAIGGLTLANGLAGFGGGIYAKGGQLDMSDLKLTNCIADGGTAAAAGGGIYLSSVTATLVNVQFTTCTAHAHGIMMRGGGGGLAIVGGSTTLMNVSATGCVADGDPALGGGLYLENATVVETNGTYTQCSVSGGTSGMNGSAVFVTGGSLKWTNGGVTSNLATRAMRAEGATLDLETCVFDGNLAGGALDLINCTGKVAASTFKHNDAGTDLGGGIKTVGGSPAFYSDFIVSNKARLGGGVYADGTGVVFASNSVPENTATENGGGFYLNSGTIQLVNNSVTDKPGGGGGAVYILNGTPVLANNILAFSKYGVTVFNATPTFSHNDVYGNTSGNYVGVSSQTGLNGNISCDPKFKDTSNDDLHILPASCCVDAGDDSYAALSVWGDVDGNARKQAAHVDIGCYERPPVIPLHVRSSTPSTNVLIGVSPADNNGAADGATPFDRAYDQNASVALTAPATTPSGNLFSRWDTGATTRTVTVSMTAEKTVTAIYAPAANLHLRSSNPISGATISVSPNDFNGQGDGTTSFDRVFLSGTQVTVAAAPTAPNGNVFASWLSGETTRTLTFTLSSDQTLTAIYAPSFVLHIDAGNASAVAITVSPNDYNGLGNGTTPFDRTYVYGKSVSLTAPATAPNGYLFQKWQRDGVDYATTAQVAVSVDKARTLVAVYVPPARALHVRSASPDSNVIVQVSPPDRNLDSNGVTPFDRTYDAGTTVTLTAPLVSQTSNCFVKWQQDGVDFATTPQVAVPMASDHTMTAVYAPIRALTVSSTPDAAVAVTVSPADLSGNGNGTTSFSRKYCTGSSVILTAPAAAPSGNVFVKWQIDGVDLSTNRQVTVAIDGDHALTAVYRYPRTITGTVVLNNYIGSAPTVTFEIRNPGTITVFDTATTKLAADGSFSFFAPAMLMDVAVKPSHWLRTTVTNVNATSGDVAVGDIEVVNGDASPDNRIGISDLSTVLAGFGTADPMADLDGSGSVGIADISIVLAGFGLSGMP